jgi:outer membrane receptor protein involved in Fe transport
MTLLAMIVAVAAATAATATTAQQVTEGLETIVVTAVTPLGSAADMGDAANVQTAFAEDLAEQRALGLAAFMNERFGSVSVNEAQGNPLQPDVRFRGFVGSPLLGLPQGISVYQDGVRVNEPFGDTVNWALIPESGIDSVQMIAGSNPLFGQNTLGGAVSVRTRNGFSYPGLAGEVSAGDFGRRRAQVEAGGRLREDSAGFVSAEWLDEDGWRDYSPSKNVAMFASGGWRGDHTTLDASVTRGRTDLVGNGAAPRQLLRTRRGAIYTRPDRTRNDLTLFNLVGNRVGPRLRVTVNVFQRASDITTSNGDDSDFEACDRAPSILCEEEDGPILLIAGVPVMADEALEGATVNRTRTDQRTRGMALQATRRVSYLNGQVTAGVTLDKSDVGFRSGTELGSLDATRRAVSGGLFLPGAATRLDARVDNRAVFFAHTAALGETVSLDLAGRYHRTQVMLRDRLGSALNGRHKFSRFNPSLGMSARMSSGVTVFASLAMSSRAPTPVELTCADEDDPCRLPNAFLADPPLDQVVSTTFEAGLRGESHGLAWRAGAFRTVNRDDLLFISAGRFTNEGFFDNVGRTRRVGVEAGIVGERHGVAWSAHYSWLDATFRDAFSVPGLNHPFAGGGEIAVSSGDRLPLVPRHNLKASVDWRRGRLHFGADWRVESGAHLRGDEGNAASPLAGHGVVDLRASLQVGRHVRVFLTIDNLLDARYETFGLFGDASEVLGERFDDPRFLTPSAPRAAFIGVRIATRP